MKERIHVNNQMTLESSYVNLEVLLAKDPALCARTKAGTKEERKKVYNQVRKQDPCKHVNLEVLQQMFAR